LFILPPPLGHKVLPTGRIDLSAGAVKGARLVFVARPGL
jgi:hypothetical protein